MANGQILTEEKRYMVNDQMQTKEGKTDLPLFWISFGTICVILILCLMNVEKARIISDYLFSFVTKKFGLTFLWGGFASLVILAWVSMSKYGSIRLGNEKPDFSTLSWFGMIFTASIACNTCLWGVIEWSFYYTNPPLGVEAKTMAAAEIASMYPLFHNGFTPWGFFGLMALPMAYCIWVKKRSVLKLSDACEGVLGEHSKGWIGKIIDVFFVFGAVAGIGTSLGMGTPMISECLNNLFGIPKSFGLDIGIVIFWTLLFVTTVWFGLEKGLKRLSDANLYLAIGLILFIFIAGPTLFILSNFTNSLSLLITKFVRISLWTDPIAKSGFPESWTIFFWAWWVAYSPFTGMFIAKISKGRTIREVVICSVAGGAMGCWMIFAILGNTSMHYELNGTISMSQIIQDQGMYAALMVFLEALPLSKLVILVWTIVGFLFMATTLSASAYSIGAATSIELKGDQEPARWNRTFWAVILAVVALTLMLMGGLKALQTASIVGALPLLGIFIIVVLSFYKWVKKDYGHISIEQIKNGYVPEVEEIRTATD